MSGRVGGGVALGRVLRRAGASVVFGMPGGQNVALVEGLRREGVRLVCPTSELAAAFMANGYARVTRRAAILTTIPGPGFTFALPGIAEARLDSVPIVWLCVAPHSSPDGRAMLQALPQAEAAGPLVKAVVPLDHGEEAERILADAVRIAEEGDPGPVMVHVAPAVLSTPIEVPSREGGPFLSGPPPLRAPAPSADALREPLELLEAARRPLLFVGQGGLDAVDEVRALVRRLRGPVLTTTTARGVIPEDHPSSLVADGPGIPLEPLDRLVDECDLVLALGCGFTHNGTHGYRLRFPPERLVYVDSRPDGVPPPFEARSALRSDVRSFLEAVAERWEGEKGPASSWDEGALVEWRGRLAAASNDGGGEPKFAGVSGESASEFFSMLRRALPRDAILVTDSGRHQMLTRRYDRVPTPGGLIVPSDLQSMGFGVPAAIGAKLAAPERPVVALIGDGGLQISAMELLVAEREGAGIGVVVFCDGELALIAEQQRREFGRDHGTRLQHLDLPLLASSLGLRHRALEGGAGAALQELAKGRGGVMVEIGLNRSVASRAGQARSYGRSSVEQALGAEGVRWLRALFGRG